MGPLIAAASPAFKEALLHGSSSRERKRLRLNIPCTALADVIGYVYTAKVTVQRENAVGLLRAACTYEMPALAKVCCDWLISKLHTYDVVALLCLCRELDSEYTENLEEASKNHIISKFSELSAEDEFYVLGYEDLKEIVQHESLDIEKEEDVVDVVMKWIGHAEETRLPHLSELLSCVHLEQTSMEFLHGLEQDPRIGNSPGCLRVIEVARQTLQAADDESEAGSSSYDEGFEDFESRDEDTLSWLSEETVLADNDDAPSASDRGAAQREGLHESYNPDSSHHYDSYSRGSCSSDYYQPESYLRDRYQSDNSSLESYSRDSYQPGNYSRDYYSSASCQPDHSLERRPRTRVDGRPDMRCKENRQALLGKWSQQKWEPRQKDTGK